MRPQFTVTVCVTLCLLIAGCVTAPERAVGPPQILIAAPIAAVRAAALAEMQSLGYLVRSSDENVMTGDKDAGMTAAVFFGSTSDPRVTKRLRWILAQEGSAVRVSAQFTMAGAGGRDAREEDMMSGRVRQQMQAALERIKARAERPR